MRRATGAVGGLPACAPVRISTSRGGGFSRKKVVFSPGGIQSPGRKATHIERSTTTAVHYGEK